MARRSNSPVNFDTHGHDSFWPHLARGFPWIIGISLLVLVMEWLGWLDPLNMIALDAAIRGNSRKAFPDLIVVYITEADYNNQETFNSRSPLDPALVLCVLQQLRESIGPKGVIGVDLDTSDPQWGASEIPVRNSAILPSACQEPAKIRKNLLPTNGREAPPHIIWTAVPRAERFTQQTELEREHLTIDCVAGGLVKYPGDEHFMGIPLFESHLGIVREYLGEFQVQSESGSCSHAESAHAGDTVVIRALVMGTLPSLSRAVVQDLEPKKKLAQKVIFNFADTYQVPAMEAGAFFKKHDDGTIGLTEKQKKALQEYRVALVGGSYAAARDRYPTPLGLKPGVELVAQAIEEDLQNRGIRESNWAVALGVDLLAGTLIVYLYFYWQNRPRKAFWMSFAVIPAIAIMASWAVFRSFAYWLSFLPVMAGMVIHQMYELQGQAARDRAKTADLQDQVAALNRQKDQLEKELAHKDGELASLRKHETGRRE